jgi:hypothetical protein
MGHLLDSELDALVGRVNGAAGGSVRVGKRV